MVQFSPFSNWVLGHVSKIKFFPTDVKKPIDFLEKVKEWKEVSVFEVSKVQKNMCIIWKTAKGQEAFVVAFPDVYLLTFYFTLQSSSCHYICVAFQRMFGQVKSTLYSASFYLDCWLENHYFISIWRLQKLLHCKLRRLKKNRKEHLIIQCILKTQMVDLQ